jgi:hypothetical protein
VGIDDDYVRGGVVVVVIAFITMTKTESLNDEN